MDVELQTREVEMRTLDAIWDAIGDQRALTAEATAIDLSTVPLTTDQGILHDETEPTFQEEERT